MNSISDTIRRLGIVPVIKIDDPDLAIPLAIALEAGGLPLAEVTFRTAAAAQAIRNIAAGCPQMMIGAGTVTTTEQVDVAVEAGASFMVSPGFNPKIVRYCIEKNVPIFPGTCTPGEMEQAMELGLDTVKFFPAEAAGGIAFLKAVGGPYPTLRFMPTGGIKPDNIASYLILKNVIACGGSWMVPAECIAAKDFETITGLTAEAVALVRRCREQGGTK
ncbi:MAG: bifunctional 4-hydroxy-2-oxoglutarate aldolase/2-dehydro-3-deoxy-phosphogluconate aldolase [Bacillota bacterium]|nr:bifunctional 4-hydroxy-2-oxoglutarate aldolase/2-dehydro-3-deoxy-phosphogluconate aldolase [Bacillota bacterium]